MDELTDRWTDVLMDRQDGWGMDGRMDAWMNRHRRRDGWIDRWIPLVSKGRANSGRSTEARRRRKGKR